MYSYQIDFKKRKNLLNADQFSLLFVENATFAPRDEVSFRTPFHRSGRRSEQHCISDDMRKCIFEC